MTSKRYTVLNENAFAHHPVHDHTACSKVLQESGLALEVGNVQLALLHAERAVQVGQQAACGECLRPALWHLSRIYVQRQDYAGAVSCFSRAQQLAGEVGDAALAEMIALGRQLCLVLDQGSQAERRLGEIQAQMSRHLAEVEIGLRGALSIVAGGPAAVSDNVWSPIAHAYGLPAGAPTVEGPASWLQADFDVCCLGLFALYHRGRRVSLPRNRKAEALLKYLVMHRERPVSRDVLMKLGWPDAGRAAAANDLNTTISVVRSNLAGALDRQLEGSPILFEDGHYRLNPALILHVDVAEFDACYRRGLACERHGQISDAMEAYQAAVALYHGDLLMGDLYDDWTIIERERLSSTFLLLLGKLSEYWLAQGRFEEAIGYGHRLLEQDPCREDAHRVLMIAYARLGQRVQALRQYELCVGLLQRELEIEPLPETTHLRHRIARGESV